MWSIHTTQCTAFKRKTILTHATEWTKLEDILLSREERERKRRRKEGGRKRDRKKRQTNTACFHLHEVPRMVKVTETESRMVVARGSGERGKESHYLRRQILL
jgi:hypothetical protein